jgi:2-polyprenyl-3-methyl-5-hydroxy-6-metoxy-1,4-benzoquinol methylase
MNCGVCGFKLRFKKNIQGEVTGNSIPIYKCIKCKSLFSCLELTNQLIENLLNDEIDGYLNNEIEVKSRINSLIRQISLEGNIRHNNKFLDIGCGVGWSSTVAKKYGFEAFGVEPEIKAVDFARSELMLNVTNSFFSSDLFEHESFDLIVMYQVLEYLPKISYLKNLITLLDKYDLFRTPEGHINNFTAESTQILAQAVKVEVIGELHNNKFRAKYFPFLGLTSGSYIFRRHLDS